MEKWEMTTILIFVVGGITFLLLGLTNSTHNLFDYGTQNESISMGIIFIIASVTSFYFSKKMKEPVRYPQGFIVGILFLIVGTAFCIWKIVTGLAFPYFLVGYFLVGFLFLPFMYVVGIIFIHESFKAKSLKNKG